MQRIKLSLQWWLITLLCWPLLWLQGKQVRKLTLRLPEANGLRAGKLGSGKPVRLLICGDSAAAGVGVMQQQQALSGQLVALLAPKYQLQWQLEAETGLDSHGVLKRLHSLQGRCFDLVVLSVGVNDVTALRSSAHFRHQLKRCLQQLEQYHGDPVVFFSAIPPMQHFSALPALLQRWLGLKAALLNLAAEDELHTWCKAYFVGTAPTLSDTMLAKDGFHPSAAGYRLWAQQLAQCISDNI